jgi:anti-sigma regulatory factor (Ser/Thr protein kinase)
MSAVVQPLRLPISDPTQASEARRLAGDLARDAGFSDSQIGAVALIVTEAGTNLAKHAHGGELLLMRVDDFRGSAIEVLSIDRGPGMSVERCISDGYSTAGTAGNGLGAIRRLSTEFDVYSSESGSVIFSRVEKARSAPRPFVFAAAATPYPGQSVCGDRWSVRETPSGVAVLVADGLGHGIRAAEAASEAVSAFLSAPWQGAGAAIETIHAALRATWGAAVAVAEVDRERGKVIYSGLGNISGVLFRPSGMRGMISYNGTAGHQVYRVAAFEYPWDSTSALIMHSDGLVSRWSLDSYPSLAGRHPGVVAGVLLRDCSRGRDDATVVVLRGNEV